ncbi:MAG: endonuclease/exonuclease/phosphatase family protein [Pseudomonadota bacterium]
MSLLSNELFSVMTLNLRFGLADDGSNRWEFRKHRLISLFSKYQPDIIGFQEAQSFQIDFLCRTLPDHLFVGKRTPAPQFWQNNLIFYTSAWRCVRHDHFFLSSTPDIPSRFPESRWPRQCTFGSFEKEGRMLDCISTHFDFDPIIQVRSARIIMERLRQQKATNPALLLGDFNATPDDPCYRVFTEKDQPDTPSSGHRFKNAFVPPFPGTHHAFTGRPDGRHIDWILFSGPIEQEHSQVISDEFDGGFPSDHFPLFARFRWKDSRSRKYSH